MKQFRLLKQDIKKILIELAVKGKFDATDLTQFDTSNLDPALKKYMRTLKENAVQYSTDVNHDDESLYDTEMVKISIALQEEEIN